MVAGVCDVPDWEEREAEEEVVEEVETGWRGG